MVLITSLHTDFIAQLPQLTNPPLSLTIELLFNNYIKNETIGSFSNKIKSLGISTENIQVSHHT